MLFPRYHTNLVFHKVLCDHSVELIESHQHSLWSMFGRSGIWYHSWSFYALITPIVQVSVHSAVRGNVTAVRLYGFHILTWILDKVLVSLYISKVSKGCCGWLPYRTVAKLKLAKIWLQNPHQHIELWSVSMISSMASKCEFLKFSSKRTLGKVGMISCSLVMLWRSKWWLFTDICLVEQVLLVLC